MIDDNKPMLYPDLPSQAEREAAGGTKYDQDKPRMDLLPWDALLAVAAVMTAGKPGFAQSGAQKYGDRNWEKGFAPNRCASAAMRHAGKHLVGETHDETGHLHLAHAAAGILMELALYIRCSHTKVS